MARRHRRDSAPIGLGIFWLDRITTASWFWARGVAMVFTIRGLVRLQLISENYSLVFRFFSTFYTARVKNGSAPA